MKITLLCLITIFAFSLFYLTAQTGRMNYPQPKLGMSFSSFGNNDVFRFESLDGGEGYRGDGFYAFGLNYVSRLNSWLEAETGLEFARHRFCILPNLPPDMDDSPREASFSMLIVPLTGRIGFLKYLFVNGGLLLNIDVSSNSPISAQSGLGFMLGAGIRYEFRFGAEVFVNPYARMNALVPFFPDNYPQRSSDQGIRFGMLFTWKNN